MKKKGFTLIELIAVLAIISLVFAIGFIRVDLVDRIRANNEVETFINDIDHCKMKAISTGRDYFLTLNKKSYTIGPGLENKNAKLIKRKVKYMTFSNYKYSEQTIKIKFTKSGTVDKPDTYTITINPVVDEELVKELRIKVGDGNARIKD